MAIQMGKALAFTAVGGLVAGLVGCGGDQKQADGAPAPPVDQHHGLAERIGERDNQIANTRMTETEPHIDIGDNIGGRKSQRRSCQTQVGNRQRRGEGCGPGQEIGGA